MQDYAEAADLFAKEIPGALPLQWHFYRRLISGEWLPHLDKAGLLGGPLWDADDQNNNARFADWPAGEYLGHLE